MSGVDMNKFFTSFLSQLSTMNDDKQNKQNKISEIQDLESNSIVDAIEKSLYEQIKEAIADENIEKVIDLNEQTDQIEKYVEQSGLSKEHLLTEFLIDACSLNNITLVKFFLDMPFQIIENNNPLVVAIDNIPKDMEDLSLIRVLLDDQRIRVNDTHTSTQSNTITHKKLGNTQNINNQLFNMMNAVMGGITPIMAAIKQNRIDILKLLSEHKDIDMNITTTAFTPFLRACIERNLEIIQFLLDDPRVDPNKYNSAGLTPLQALCKLHKSEYVEVIEYLINHPRIDSTKLTRDGESTLELLTGGYTNVIKKLLDS